MDQTGGKAMQTGETDQPLEAIMVVHLQLLLSSVSMSQNLVTVLKVACWINSLFNILAVEVLENLAYLANASNLVLYLTKFMNFSPSTSANTVTTFMGTAFLLALSGGFLSDSYFTTYSIYLISATIELLVRFQNSFLLQTSCLLNTVIT